MKALNRYRARRSDRALFSYDTGCEPVEQLTDFLADARHWCDNNGYDFAALDRQAYGHYFAEALAAVRERKLG